MGIVLDQAVNSELKRVWLCPDDVPVDATPQTISDLIEMRDLLNQFGLSNADQYSVTYIAAQAFEAIRPHLAILASTADPAKSFAALGAHLMKSTELAVRELRR